MRRLIEARARALGFDILRVARPDSAPELPDRLAAWLDSGAHGEMVWMEERAEARAEPAGLWQEVRSVVMLGMSYAPEGNPLDLLARRDRGAIAAYAQRRDYHEVMKGKLKELGGLLAAKSGRPVKVFVDTAPVMEKPLAEAAGLGWQGKHTVLISREFGNWLLLGALYSAADLEPDAPETEHCGTCRRCLDICPTAAFPAPFRLDARRCLSYLTIEHAGPIPVEFRVPMGNRVFGCDDCLAICPWNKFAGTSREGRLAARNDLEAPALHDLARLDEAAFRRLFANTPVKRTGRDRFLRNVLIAIGNSGDPALSDEAVRCLDDPAPIVRGMAVWACGRLLGSEACAELYARSGTGELDAHVRAEWRVALAMPDGEIPLP
ncbi:tRNA epoxyqueuosine(34) reductase QueG [Methylobacterium durans]|uniref:tRNA epoxyqueuosine(34) reductase QueG n=1 Tax=Methylobacterium durans TaxID=2202825 RepID=UPI002AFF175B|nr:tRNA epoxyqueuosine(34) reductase QueG [Methylobacterium durans]MEA1831770.1 tRNA epoxyqueuosine(34) reductase QueG [Methylobacterium durans]